jgi:hypothetical protein
MKTIILLVAALAVSGTALAQSRGVAGGVTSGTTASGASSSIGAGTAGSTGTQGSMSSSSGALGTPGATVGTSGSTSALQAPTIVRRSGLYNSNPDLGTNATITADPARDDNERIADPTRTVTIKEPGQGTPSVR